MVVVGVVDLNLNSLRKERYNIEWEEWNESKRGNGDMYVGVVAVEV